MHVEWMVANQNKKKLKSGQDTIHFNNAIYIVLHERCNITAFFEEHLKFQEKLTFTNALWINSCKPK